MADCLHNTTSPVPIVYVKCMDFAEWGNGIPREKLCVCNPAWSRTGPGKSFAANASVYVMERILIKFKPLGCQDVLPVGYVWVTLSILVTLYEAFLVLRIVRALIVAKRADTLRANTVLAVLLLCIAACVLLSWWMVDRIFKQLPGPPTNHDIGRVISGLAASASKHGCSYVWIYICDVSTIDVVPQILLTTVWDKVKRASDNFQKVDLAHNQKSQTLAISIFCVIFGTSMTVLAFVNASIVTGFMLLVYIGMALGLFVQANSERLGLTIIHVYSHPFHVPKTRKRAQKVNAETIPVQRNSDK